MEAIEDHALIGNGRTAALVSRRGSVDWLCWPRFDSPAVFGGLLDDRAGAWTLRPAGRFESGRRYLPGTNVLETRFLTAGGRLTVTDLMPVASEEEKRRQLLPNHELLRVATCDAGAVDLEMVLEPRPMFGAERPRLRRAGELGVRMTCPSGLLLLRSELPLEVDSEGHRVRARVRLSEGDTAASSLTFAADEPVVVPPLGIAARETVARTCRWWRAWASSLRYDGPWRDSVLRSALALKLMGYAPSGAIVAAPTTSLPEAEGGELNWDYRYCWLRDAALTTRALYGLGCTEEAEGFVGWLLHSTRLSRPDLRILYDVYGRSPPRERTLALEGYRHARPVRVGNAAVEQLQLDVHGEVIDAATQLVRRGGRLDREVQRTLIAWGNHVCRGWNRADEGIWEPRTGRAHHTHSRVLCWVALDRLLALNAAGHLPGAPVEQLERNRDQIRAQVQERAWNPRLGSYVDRLDGDEVDASLLMMAWYGFEPAGSERMCATWERIRQELGAPGGLLYRYRTDPPGAEGAFGICSFWGVDYLARCSPDPAPACERFEALCGRANDVGLFGEEIDPTDGRPLGNFPQAFTHVGLINAALTLSERLRSRLHVGTSLAAPGDRP